MIDRTHSSSCMAVFGMSGVVFLDRHESVVSAHPSFSGGEVLEVAGVVLVKRLIAGGEVHVVLII
jgi:hypothetical protein